MTEPNARSASLSTRRRSRVTENAWRVVRIAGRYAKQSPTGAAAAIVIILVSVVAIFAHFIAPMDPMAAHYDALRQGPSWHHLLGTDYTGRDVLSRVIYGARISLVVSVSAVAFAKGVGFAWGVASGYVGGIFDLVSQRVIDVLLAFPGLVLALLLLAALGSGLHTLIIAIGISTMAGSTRVIRSAAIGAKNAYYVEAAKAIGASPLRIMIRHIAPQTIAPLLIIVSASLGGAIFAEAALSFLGLGLPPTSPSWGTMMAQASTSQFAPLWWLAVFPGIAITLTILAFNLLGDDLRDRLDPRLRGEF